MGTRIGRDETQTTLRRLDQPRSTLRPVGGNSDGGGKAGGGSVTADPLTIWSVRAAVVLYTAALAVSMLGGAPRKSDRRKKMARNLWTWGLLAYLVHMVAAFHFVHAWSHRHASLETARQTEELVGVASGVGLWLNYLFTLVWAADVIRWWRDPSGHARRPRGMRLAVHFFLAFMFFNGTVVFASGFARSLGIAAMLTLLVAWFASRQALSGGIRRWQGLDGS